MKMIRSLYAKMGLRIGWEPSKYELDLSNGCDTDGLDLPRGEDGRPLLNLVHGLETRHGVPRHQSMCADFIIRAL
jgi:hypothetical protein